MKILFISHDASRTGAPILLRNFIKWLHQNTEHKGTLILRIGGILETDFNKLTNTHIFYPKWYNHYPTIIKRLLNRSGWYKQRLNHYHNELLRKLKKENFDLIYSNTIVNTDVLEFLKTLHIPVITHIRELETTINHYGGRQLIEKLNSQTTKFIADSYSVKVNLIGKHKIAKDKISVVHEYVEIPERLPETSVKERIRQKHNIPEDTFIVGASGGGLWRKGYDLFIQTAIATCNQPNHQNTYFIWVGDFKEKDEVQLRYDIEKSGLEDKILFVGTQKEPLNYFSLFDVFILASREEPFGIVGMEAALFNTPIICFEKAGGMPEFVGNDCGLTIPYLNIPKVVEAINFFKENPQKREEMGNNARNKVLKEHSLETKSKEILNIIENFQ
ncbi:glycosyltransferase family 4 protein [Anaerophaga thermohalophila]|uniref:glycosyltransferase family 4 protein n=1 Tax=Anaerophaga thermohalophila TaxID=177400 RepID=UPI000237D39C|nr:glycosyltransferase family 4 protein [Anaerophaga thermohalophila]